MTNEELTFILKNEQLNIELKEAEKEYQRLTKITNDRHNKYRSAGLGYILDTEKVMNWSDRRKLMNPISFKLYKNNTPLILSILKTRMIVFVGVMFAWAVWS